MSNAQKILDEKSVVRINVDAGVFDNGIEIYSVTFADESGNHVKVDSSIILDGPVIDVIDKYSSDFSMDCGGSASISISRPSVTSPWTGKLDLFEQYEDSVREEVCDGPEHAESSIKGDFESEEHFRECIADLQSHGIHELSFVYEGSGDSGDVTDISLNDNIDPGDLPGPLRKILDDIVYGVMSMHGGFENNDGGGGEVELVFSDDGIQSISYSAYNNVMKNECVLSKEIEPDEVAAILKGELDAEDESEDESGQEQPISGR